MAVADRRHNDYHSIYEFNAVGLVQDAGSFHGQVLVHGEKAVAGQYVGLLVRLDDAGLRQSGAFLRVERPRRRHCGRCQRCGHQRIPLVCVA